ncbi:MAG: dihydroorotate dehydrogenase-like protein [Halieaceae bacterium]|jgi:dihydroorotate dehydrogenase (fumarate)|nr:dihydroorotate dehydrogenase-like protein [Halieaceae bacterium]
MTDLRATYLGLELANPLVPSSSPLTGDLDAARRLEDAGAAAIIMPSLFEEVIRADEARLERFLEQQDIGHLEADSYRPLPTSFRTQEEIYLDTLARLKQSLSIPVIASLNGVTAEGWLEHALALQEAGADALELNVYYLAADPEETAVSVEDRYVDLATVLRGCVSLPLAVKLGAQLTAPIDLVRRLEGAGVDGVSIFNRFYQPDIDLETLEVTPRLELSSPAEALLRVRWAAMLFGRCRCGLAVTGGFHRSDEVLKALLAGADVVHLCSVLLEQGPAVIGDILSAMTAWLEDHEYESVAQLRGSMSERNAPDPARYARANYVEVLDNYTPPAGVYS